MDEGVGDVFVFSCCQTSFCSLMKRRGPLSCPHQVRPQTRWPHMSLSYEVVSLLWRWTVPHSPRLTYTMGNVAGPV